MKKVTRIYKYPIQLLDQQVLTLPKDAEFLSAGFQDGNLMVWARVLVSDLGLSESETEGRSVAIFGTGHSIPPNLADAPHIGTIFDEDMVWHIFDAGVVEDTDALE